MQNQQEVGCSVLEGLFHFVSFLRHSGPNGGPGFVFLTPPFPFSSHFTILAGIPPRPAPPVSRGVVPMVTPPLWGDKGWHLGPPEPNSAL